MVVTHANLQRVPNVQRCFSRAVTQCKFGPEAWLTRTGANTFFLTGCVASTTILFGVIFRSSSTPAEVSHPLRLCIIRYCCRVPCKHWHRAVYSEVAGHVAKHAIPMWLCALVFHTWPRCKTHQGCALYNMYVSLLFDIAGGSFDTLRF